MPSSTLTLLSPAKLNLFLHITGRRDDGYHLLQTVFQLLNYGDTLRFTVRQDSIITLSPQIPGVHHDDNLIVRAARLLQQHTQCPYGVDIELDKRLPMGGGIGGGSSNAATTLLALNHLWQTHLSLDQLSTLGITLGADVPIFIHGSCAWAEGIGEKLTHINTPEHWFLVVTPDCHVSTSEIFSSKQLTRSTSATKIAAFLGQPPLSFGHNDCEAIVRERYPAVADALNWLNQFGTARMTGTGASIFTSFLTEAEAKETLVKLPSHFKGFVAQGTNQSPVHRQLGLS